MDYRKLRATGKRLILRPYKVSDFRELQHSHRGRLPAVDRFDDAIPTSKESDLSKHKERLARHKKNAREGYHYIFGVFENKSGAYVGQIDFLTINKYLRWANIGYHIQNQYYGKGDASEAGRVGLKLAFKSLGFHRVEAAMELNNKASRNVALKIGLKPEGVRRKFFPEKGGIDMFIYANNVFDYK